MTLSPPMAKLGVTLVIVVLLLMIGTVALGAIQAGRVSLPLLLEFVPLAFYLVAVLAARQAIAAVGSGRSLAVPTLLARIGLALFLGGIARVFVVPLIERAIRGAGAYAYFDVAAITVGAIGVTLLILAGLVREGEAARAELGEMI